MARYMVAIDGSDHSERAFQFYIENLHKEGNSLILVHAVEYPYIPSSPYIRGDIKKNVFEQAKQEGIKIDLKFKELCDKYNIKCVVLTEFASPGEFIVKKAEETKAEMIIMGTRGLGSVRRTILGSVSDYVLHHAHCPVLISKE